MKKLDNEPAFSVDEHVYLGLSKREYFAARAMQGLLTGSGPYQKELVIKKAMIHADALIEELEKKK